MAEQQSPSTIGNIPGVGKVEFPSSMSEEEMNAEALRLYHEHQSGAARVTEWATSPLIPQIADAARAIAEKTDAKVPHIDDTSVWEARVRGFLVGVLGGTEGHPGLGDVMASMTAPINAAMMLAGLGPESKIAEAVPGLKGLLGLKSVATLRRAVATVGSGGAVEQGTVAMASGDTAEDKLLGMSQAAGGLAGMGSDPLAKSGARKTARGVGESMAAASKRPGYIRAGAIGIMGGGSYLGHPGAAIPAGLGMMVVPPLMEKTGTALRAWGEQGLKAKGLEYNMPNIGAPASPMPRSVGAPIRFAGAERPTPTVEPTGPKLEAFRSDIEKSLNKELGKGPTKDQIVSGLNKAKAEATQQATTESRAGLKAEQQVSAVEDKADLEQLRRDEKTRVEAEKKATIETKMAEGGFVEKPPQFTKSMSATSPSGETLTSRQQILKPPTPKTPLSEIDTIKEQFGESGPIRFQGRPVSMPPPPGSTPITRSAAEETVRRNALVRGTPADIPPGGQAMEAARTGAAPEAQSAPPIRMFNREAAAAPGESLPQRAYSPETAVESVGTVAAGVGTKVPNLVSLAPDAAAEERLTRAYKQRSQLPRTRDAARTSLTKEESAFVQNLRSQGADEYEIDLQLRRFQGER